MHGVYLAFILLLLNRSATAQEYLISTYAGGATLPTPIRALEAPIGAPTALYTDGTDNIYFMSLNAVFKLDRDGIITRVAGNSRQGYSGDGGPASNAQLRVFYWYSPVNGLTLREGNLFIADRGNHCIRRVSPDGTISTVAGNGIEGFSGDGGAATSAQLSSPAGIAFDEAGNLLVGDWGNSRVRKISTDGTISTVAGVGKCCGSLEDGVAATRAQLGGPAGLAIDTASNLYIADSSQSRVRKVSPEGIITTVSDTGLQVRPNTFTAPTGVTVDAAGNLFITYSGVGLVRKVAPDGTISTVAGGGDGGGDTGPATSARLNYPQATAIDSAGNLYIADSINSRIRRVSPEGTMSTVAGGGTFASVFPDEGSATSALLALGAGDPSAMGGVAVDSNGNLYIAETGLHRIRRVSHDGEITTVAGTGTPGYAGDNGAATEAQLNFPLSVAVDGAGNLYIADTGNNHVRKVSPGGSIGTVPRSDSDAGALAAVAVDSAGNLFIANWNLIRKITPEGALSVVAGGGGLIGSTRDGRPATEGMLYYPCGLAIDRADNLFIADCNDGALKVSPDGTLHVVPLPGRGTPRGVGVDAVGNAFFAKSDSDWDISGGAEHIYKVSPGGNVIPIAGTGSVGYTGDGGPASAAELAGPAGAAVDGEGNIYFADTGNGAVRVLRPSRQH